ncbi:MAG: imidazoleglycerol-phosphate dehydratase HisB [Candidatus Micrarchaeota archaeon]
MRLAMEKRKTKETTIEVQVNIDGTGESKINTGVGFFDHLLTALSKYSLIDMQVSAQGDLETGTHHTVEDVGIVLGSAIAKALSEKKGINRAGWFEFRYMMDDAIAESIVDLSGRGRLIFEDKNSAQLKYSSETVSDLATEDIKEFFWAMASSMKANIAIRLTRSGNAHHEIEASFKAFGKALRLAVENDPRQIGKIPSTKGVI